MAFYEHTFVGKPNLSANELKALTDKYYDFINSSGKILKTEQWGLLNLSSKIKKNKKGLFVHIKFEAKDQLVKDLEKKLTIENSILRFLTVKYDKLDLQKEYFTNEKLDLKQEIPLFNIDENENIEMSNIKIKSAFCNINDQLIYVYDFLKMWRFLVTYEKTSKRENEETKVIYSVGEMPKKAPEIIFKSENDSENSDDIFYDDEDQYLI